MASLENFCFLAFEKAIDLVLGKASLTLSEAVIASPEANLASHEAVLVLLCEAILASHEAILVPPDTVLVLWKALELASLEVVLVLPSGALASPEAFLALQGSAEALQVWTLVLHCNLALPKAGKALREGESLLASQEAKLAS